MRTKSILALALAWAVVLLLVVAGASAQGSLTPAEELGKALFFDPNLSTPPGQSCATCHAPEVGFTGRIRPSTPTARSIPGAVPRASATASRPRPPMAAKPSVL